MAQTNKEIARKQLETSIINDWRPIDFMGDTRLSDGECLTLAIETPFSFQTIRATFPIK